MTAIVPGFSGVAMSKSLFPALLGVAFFLPAVHLSAQGGQQQRVFPDGRGKEVVETLCTSCHSARNIFNSAGYDREGWRRLFGAMVALPEAQAELVATYLAQNFPAKPGRNPTMAAGGESVKITEWVTPTLGQRTRDPLEARDGSIWWTGMWASLVGRIDTETGEMKEYLLPKTARPHGIAEGPQGNIWYTGNGNGTVGKVDPQTGAITEYETTASDPHTPIFDREGNLVFTAQRSKMVGRLNPTTGELVEVPTKGTNPYGIQMDSQGMLWIGFNGSAMLGRLDPETMELDYYDLPDPASRVRRVALTSDDMVWFVNSALGRIGRLNPKSGEIKEWPSPSGPDSHPYAMAVVDDVIWYNESGMRPDVLVRFDPKTEKFQSFPIPSGVGIVRNMFVTKEGNLLIHQSSMNSVGLVQLRNPVF
jgi:virginiamycin B lyase